MLPGEWWSPVLLIGFIVVGVWFALQPRCAFVVRIAKGQPKAIRGKVTAAFLDQIRETCERHGVRNGTVRGLIRGKRICLGFSRSLPQAGQQQLRNWWANWGWLAKPIRA
jgi:hypothetical protein